MSSIDVSSWTNQMYLSELIENHNHNHEQKKLVIAIDITLTSPAVSLNGGTTVPLRSSDSLNL